MQSESLLQSLKTHFGYDRFRPGQMETISRLLDGRSSLAIFPTGSGKSLCYQLSAMHLPHLTLVVSPLLALMKDQIAFLRAKGINAASLDSAQDKAEANEVMAGVRSGAVKILMISVERFKNERFRAFISQVPVSMLVVDEAHCISEWGHNFRPDYLKLPRYRDELKIPLVLLLTATATKKVKRDMAERFAIDPDCIIQTGFYRSNLDLTVLSVREADKPGVLADIVRRQNGAGIVYVTLQQSAERVAQNLQRCGVNAVAYHAGLQDQERHRIQDAFMAGQIPLVVATIAFGMGVDKSDIRFVIHYDLPKSIENYSQEIGRAGRDGQASYCYTLANLDGLTTVENFVYGDTPEPGGIAHVLNDIKENALGGSWEMQELALSGASNIRQLALKTLLVQLELKGVLEPLYAYYADFKYKFIEDKSAILARFDQARYEFLSLIFSHTEFKKVWGTLNFDALGEQADRKRVVAALDYLAEQGLIELETKRITQVYRVDAQALAQPELADSLYAYFADKESAEIKRIGALVRFFELERCLSSNLARYFDDANAPEACGHCSVCRGHPVKLGYSVEPQWPGDERLKGELDALKKHLASKGIADLSIDSQSRFLAGISVPLFARNKVRQLSGFALCEKLPYGEIRAKVAALTG